jgi:hypothetical protein
MIEYSLEPFHEIAADVCERIPAHFAENKHYGKPNLDWDYYLQSSYAGQCKAVTIRDDGKLVGYTIFFITNDPDRKHVLQATNSGIFVDDDYRGKASIQLLKKADAYMKDLGAQEINYLIKDDRIGKLLSRQAYKQDYKLWSKTL